MGEVLIYNFVTETLTTHTFDSMIEAEDFAYHYDASEDEEVCIGNGVMCMELSDYCCYCFG